MDRIIQSPGKYIQGADAISRLGGYLKPLAERWLIVGDKFVLGFAEENCVKAWQMPIWLAKSRRLAANAHTMKSTACVILPVPPAAQPCWVSAAARRWIPQKH